MAATIFHGAPGSYKSSSAFWFEVLPALKQGRLVVTNIEGLLTLESIEIELNITFPETAKLWRLSSQSDKGKFLWQRWFWWMPVGAFVVMDEIQDIFPADATVFKPKDFDSLGIETIKDQLPEAFYKHHYEAKRAYTPPLDEGSTDDTGETILDKDGLIIYPPNMREANMRHRKFSWDIIYCTPDITEIHKLVRSVCEFAYAHKYNKNLEFIPYYKARTRIHEHSPKSNGYPRKKDDPTKWRKIPDEVFKCYRSTSTGQHSGRKGVNPFASASFVISLALFFLPICYLVWWGFIKEDAQENLLQTETIADQNNQFYRQNPDSPNRSPNTNDNNQDNSKNDIPVTLPYNIKEIYLNGYVDVIINKQKSYKNYFFTGISKDKEIYLNEEDLFYQDFKIKFVNPCKVQIIKNGSVLDVYCPPNIKEDTEKEQLNLTI